MRITISGYPGAGKTTIGQIIAQRLHYEFHSVGKFRRKKAKDLGMTIQKYNALGETDSSTDLEADKYQTNLGKNSDNFIFEGRLSFHFIPDSLKVFLDVNPEIGAQRVLKDQRPSEQAAKTLEAMIEILTKRVESDKKRYRENYDFDCYDFSHYDLVIDTSLLTAQEVAEQILSKI